MDSNAIKKYVFAHFMMGNTYPYRPQNFHYDVSEAIATGIDGFALNLGNDFWTSSKVETIFTVVQANFPSFKLFFSFDMSIITSPSLILEYRGRYFMSTFAGETQSFGHESVTHGWDIEIKQPLRQKGIEICFVPSWTAIDAWEMFRRFPVIDGAFSWAAWPFPDFNTPHKYDTAYVQTAKEYGKVYMAGVSPCFFAHFSWKNWVYPETALLPRRLQELVTLQPDLIQIISWNGKTMESLLTKDWGESHYLGTLQNEAGIPEGAEKWINGFNHEPWRDICKYFIQAYKSGGRFPLIQEDKVIFWYASHLNSYITPSQLDPIPCPMHAALVRHKLVAAVFLKDHENEVILQSGGESRRVRVNQGFHVVDMDLFAGKQIVTIIRQKEILRGEGDMEVTSLLKEIWNYNLHVFRAC